MKVAVIKYNAGNVFSVISALRRIGIEASLTSDAKEILSADRVIFPGVGEASSAMLHLRQTGLIDTIKAISKPVLGICIGQQLLCRHSEEGNCDCIGIFNTDVKKFPTESILKVPHIGWNNISINKQNKLVTEDINNKYTYFVHSYYVPVNEYTIATTEYILPFSAAMNKDNFYSTQFHPEKSGDIGEIILKNFIKL